MTVSAHPTAGWGDGIIAFFTRHGAPLLIALLSLAALILDVALNYPYRPFPTDELWSYAVPLRGEEWLATKSEILLNSPLHIYTLLAVKPLVKLLGMGWLQSFLFTAALALSVGAFLVGMTVQAATRRLPFALGAALLFAASAWSQGYLHLYTYGPVAAMFMMASLYLFTRYYLSEAASPLTAGAAGLCTGLFFLSSSSAKLLAGILIVTYILLILGTSRAGRIRGILWLAGAALVPVIAFLPLYLEPLMAHLRTNASGGNGLDCLQKFGFLPTTPFPSFFYLLSVYSPPLLLFLCGSLVVALLKATEILRLGRRGTLTLALLGIVLVHTVALDLLPFTKLGRTQFPLLPVAIVALSLLASDLPARGRLGRWLFSALLVLAVPQGIATSVRTWQARRAAPAELDRLPAATAFVVVEEDPHHDFITAWLQYPRHFTLPLADLHWAIRARKTPVALIVGPTGPDSGKSVLRDSVLDDFSFTLPPGIGILPGVVKKLPYYASYPLFMMEEENSQCFFFRHQTPDPDAPQSHLTLYYWP